MPPSITIGKHAATCLDLFSKAALLLAQTEGSKDQNVLLDEFGRFKLWTSNIGVFADLHSSLDYRLRDFGDIKDSFSRQLITIENRLQQLHDAAQKTLSKPLTKENEQPDIPTSTESPTSAIFLDWNNKQLLHSVHQSVDWLHRLSNLVRKASFANQHKRADRFKLKDENGNDLSDTLTNYYSKLIKREFNGVQDNIVQRLAASMLTRRRRIMYRRSQQQSWKIQQVEPKMKSLELATPSTKSAPTPLVTDSPLQNERVTDLQPEARASAPSRLTATTIDATIRRNISAPSGISKGSTAPMNEQSKLLVPPPPKGSKFGEDFVCDYCCLILPRRIALNSNAWADHVNKDLYPYVCVVDNCDDPIEIYSSRKEWLAHMRTRHMMKWYCLAKPHTKALEFERGDQFIEHMRNEHPGRFRDEQLPLVAENSSRPKDPVFDDCPFCTETPANLEDHVALHLRDLALRSLPWPDDDEGYSQQGAYLHSDSSTSEIARHTIVDFMSESDSLESNFTENSDDDDESKHSAGERLHLYGHFQEISDQHKPIDLREQLSDKILARLAMKKYQGDYPRLATLINALEDSQGDKYSHNEATSDFNEAIDILQQIITGTSQDQQGWEGAICASPDISPGSARDNIKIGIICTSINEFGTMGLVFDEILDESGSTYGGIYNDVNIYTIGRIGRHKVVLTYLSHMKESSTTDHAANFRSSYNQLEVVLLVGACGGVPEFGRGEDAEMLLGDIVISKSVVEYEVGETDKFILKDTLEDNLSRASEDIRALYGSFSTKRIREILQEDTARFLADIQAKDTSRKKGRGSKVKSQYRYPGTAADRLFKPDYIHKHRSIANNRIDCTCYGVTGAICSNAQKASCQDIGCDESQLVVRESLIEKRAIEHLSAQEAQRPKIHFGAIASGGSLMTNGLERDNTSQKGEFIAFGEEVEIWKGVPYLLINGVYNYADGHNDDLQYSWEMFAAAAAAAAAKAVLQRYEAHQDI